LCLESARISQYQVSTQISWLNYFQVKKTVFWGCSTCSQVARLSRFTVFALGIMPYISASIIMQLTTIIVPSLEAMKKEGPAGQRKITQYTRYATVVLATFQALGISVALEAQPGLVIDPGMAFQVYTVITLVTGTMFLMWLGEQITERGLGNGISIIIFAGIVVWLAQRSWRLG
jgi:preprotein translocase subunit SecY